MSIKPVDFQILIPKTSEVSKIQMMTGIKMPRSSSSKLFKPSTKRKILSI